MSINRNEWQFIFDIVRSSKSQDEALSRLLAIQPPERITPRERITEICNQYLYDYSDTALSSYRIDPALRAKGIIPYAFIQRRLSNVANYRRNTEKLRIELAAMSDILEPCEVEGARRPMLAYRINLSGI